MFKLNEIVSSVLPFDIGRLFRTKSQNHQFPTRCQLHSVDLELNQVPIKYGHFTPDTINLIASKYLYPNANRSIRAGCVVREKKNTEILACLKCREAEDKWLAFSRVEQAESLYQILEKENHESFRGTIYPLNKQLDDILILIKAVIEKE